jgi:hypothetical protein
MTAVADPQPPSGTHNTPGTPSTLGTPSTPHLPGSPGDGGCADLDLDGTLPPTARPTRPSWAAGLLVLVLAALAGAGAHAAVAPGRVVGPPRLSAQVVLDAVRLTDRPTATLHLVVASHDDADVVVTSLRLSGAGVVEQRQQLWRPLTPGLVEDLRLDAPLPCSDTDARTPLQLTLTVTRPASGNGVSGNGVAGATIEVTAEPAGPAGVPGGLCRAEEQQLPQAFGTQAPARLVSISGTSLTLALTDLPAEASELFAAQADGWFLPLLPSGPQGSPGSQGLAPVTARRATMVLGLPQPQCRDLGTRGLLPTGLQLLYVGGSGVHEVYAEVGPALAAWLLEGRRRSCPDQVGVS